MGAVMVVLDPAPVVARQAGRVLARHGEPRQQDENQVIDWTSGNAHGFRGATAIFEAGLGCLASDGRGRQVAGPVRRVRWERTPAGDGRLSESRERSYWRLPGMAGNAARNQRRSSS